MNKQKNYYKILKVSKKASYSEIKKKYYQLAQKYHPDHSKESDAEIKMMEINLAYGVLSDSSKRERYDLYLTSKESQYQKFEENNWDDFFSFENEEWLRENDEIKDDICIICYFENQQTLFNNCKKEFHSYDFCGFCEKKITIATLKYFFGPYKEIPRMIFVCSYICLLKLEKKLFEIAEKTFKKYVNQEIAKIKKHYNKYQFFEVVSFFGGITLLISNSLSKWWGILLFIICILVFLFCYFQSSIIKSNVKSFLSSLKKELEKNEE